MNRRFLLNLAAVLFFFSPEAAPGQQRPALPMEEGGGVTATLVLELSFKGLARAPDALSRVFPLPDGGWGVSSRVFDGVVQTFAADGSPAGTIGRAGRGPGEFAGQVFGVVSDDGLWLLDPANVRLSLFDSTLALVHDRPVPARIRSVAAVSGAGAPVLATGFITDGGETHAVARLGHRAGEDVFGGELETDNARVSLKVAAEDSVGRIWTFANSGGAVNVLDADDLHVQRRWWLPGEFRREAPRRPEPTAPPVPQALGAVAGGQVVWLLMGVADSEWSPEVNPARDGATAYWDTAILAIDPSRAARVARGPREAGCEPLAPG